MGGEVDTGFVHARIYGQYGRLLKRKDYEILANRQSPREGTAGFIFKSPGAITTKTREEIFRTEFERLFTLFHLNRQYRRTAAVMAGLFEIENLKNSAASLFSHYTVPPPFYDTSPLNRLHAGSLQNVSSPEELHEIIKKSPWHHALPAEVPPDFRAWEGALEQIQREILRRGWRRFDSLVSFSPAMDLAALMAVTLSMKKLIYRSISGTGSEGEEEQTDKEMPAEWISRLQEWRGIFEGALERDRKKYFYDEEGILLAERKLHSMAWHHARKNLFSDFHNSVTGASFMFLWFYQVKNLFAIAEGIRLGRKASKIMELVVCGE